MIEKQLEQLNTNLAAIATALTAIAAKLAYASVSPTAAPAAPAGQLATATDFPASIPGKPLTYDDVKRPFLDLIKVKGNVVGRAVLNHFGFKASLTEATPEQYAGIIAHIVEASK